MAVRCNNVNDIDCFTMASRELVQEKKQEFYLQKNLMCVIGALFK